jgi:hypothetical protein
LFNRLLRVKQGIVGNKNFVLNQVLVHQVLHSTCDKLNAVKDERMVLAQFILAEHFEPVYDGISKLSDS